MNYVLLGLDRADGSVRAQKSSSSFYRFLAQVRDEVFVVGIPEEPADGPAWVRALGIRERERLKLLDRSSTSPLREIFD